MRQVIVTGGAGFIGSHLVSAALGSGSEITVVDKASRPQSFPASSRLKYRRMNALKIEGLLPKPYYGARIVHLAAETSVEKSVQNPVSTVKSNISVTCSTLELARKIDSKRFLFASSAAVYGERDERCREADSPDPESPYAVSKLASEHYCKIYSKLYGIPTVILRYFNVYGPGQSNQYAGAITRFVQRTLEGKPPVIFGDGNQTRDFVFINDVVRATLTVLQKPLPGGSIMNIGTGTPIKIKSLARMVLGILGAERLQPVYTSPRPGDIRHSLADISLAKEKISFQPRYSLEAGLRATIEWFRGSN
jgi:UDP-glucose 4-epimerase